MLGFVYLFFFVTTIYFVYLYRAHLNRYYQLVTTGLATQEKEQKMMSAREQELEEENKKRELAVSKTINLYEVAKEVGEFLDEDKIFTRFKKGLSRFIHFDECLYIDERESHDKFPAFEIIPLMIKKKHYGYLALSGLQSVERPILDILISQFVLGLKRARLYTLVQELAITDELTKTFTRRHFLVRFGEELKRLTELDLSLGFLMIDIDNFKGINDTYGHVVGDVVLRSIADVIRSNCREIDLIGRFGGEEFMVALPMTMKDGALFAAERIRQSIASAQIKAFDEFLQVTISIGVAIFPDDAKEPQELLDKSDWALYRSKRTGKNKVSVYARYE